MSWYDAKQSDSKFPVLVFWAMWSTSSLLLLPAQFSLLFTYGRGWCRKEGFLTLLKAQVRGGTLHPSLEFDLWLLTLFPTTITVPPYASPKAKKIKILFTVSRELFENEFVGRWFIYDSNRKLIIKWSCKTHFFSFIDIANTHKIHVFIKQSFFLINKLIKW